MKATVSSTLEKTVGHPGKYAEVSKSESWGIVGKCVSKKGLHNLDWGFSNSNLCVTEGSCHHINYDNRFGEEGILFLKSFQLIKL